jgi:aminoglycoside phosphotransferase (APT) family kinase protein
MIELKKTEFDPNDHRLKCERYLSSVLGCPVDLIRVEMLAQSTRQAPWRMDVSVNGIEKSFVLQLDERGLDYEYQILKAMEAIPIPTPGVYDLDLEGKALGVASFIRDYVAGESLLEPVLAGEAWAEQLYLDSVYALQAISETDLDQVVYRIERETANDVLENANDYFKGKSNLLAERMYEILKATQPEYPTVCFSNGDLWLDNFITQEKKLAGIIDFQHACFSDPIFEFLLSFFVAPELQGRGIEERYCQHLGCDPEILNWYRGLEFFDTWHWVLHSGNSFVHHTVQSLEANIIEWLRQNDPAN